MSLLDFKTDVNMYKNLTDFLQKMDSLQSLPLQSGIPLWRNWEDHKLLGNQSSLTELLQQITQIRLAPPTVLDCKI